MSVYVRQAKAGDLKDLYLLAQQFVLLNLPANKYKLEEILEVSEKSFAGELSKQESEYLFVVVDSQDNRVVGASKVVAKHGVPENPHVYYKITKREKFSSDLGLGFVHQILNFCEDKDGPTELGGLVVDTSYRGRPEKVGKLVSLSRFMYLAAFPERFEDRLHCELAPPLNKDGRSEFWEALGRRFTGLPYDEADRLSHLNKGFITSLFPEGDIYMTLLESKARLVVGEVAQQTRPARALMERWGFKYKNEIDPFDGGPHLGVSFSEAKPVQSFIRGKLNFKDKIKSDRKIMLLGGFSNGEFRSMACSPELEKDQVFINKETIKLLGFEDGQEVFLLPMSYKD